MEILEYCHVKDCVMLLFCGDILEYCCVMFVRIVLCYVSMVIS